MKQKSKGLLKKANEKCSKLVETGRIPRYWRPKTINNISIDDLEKVNYNNNTNISDLVDLKKTATQIAAKKIVEKYRNLARKKLSKPWATISDGLADLEMVDYNNDTNIRDLNDIADGLKKNKNAQIAAQNILQKYKKMSKKKVPLPFDLNDIVDTKAVYYNNDTNINYVLSSKGAEITATKIVNKYKNLRR